MHLDFYSFQELAKVVKRSADILKIKITDEAALSIAKRSRSTPRIANKMLKRIRDFAQVKGEGIIDEKSPSFKVCAFYGCLNGFDRNISIQKAAKTFYKTGRGSFTYSNKLG